MGKIDLTASRVNKWNKVKEEQWGEAYENGSENYNSPNDYLVDEFLHLNTDGGLGYLLGAEYDEATKSYGVSSISPIRVLDTYNKYTEQGQEFKINGKIEVPVDTDTAWNEKHYNEADERLANAYKSGCAVEISDSEEVEDQKKALGARYDKMRKLLMDVYTVASSNEVDGKQKNIAGVIDERIAYQANTLQYIAGKENLSEDEKLARIRVVLDNISLMKQLEGFVLGYNGQLSEDIE